MNRAWMVLAAASMVIAGISYVTSGGEAGGSIPATRARIEALWNGARVVDHHGMTEIGPVSYECPQRRGVLHLIEFAFIAEIIDSELVLTNLGRTGSPLLRYRTGDVVKRALSDRCECGTSDLALEGGILGRTDDMVVVRGVNVYPAAIEDVLRGCDGLAEYRVEIDTHHALPELKIQIEPSLNHQDPTALEQRVKTALSNALGLSIPVSTVLCGTLPRFEMKARRWVRR